MRGTNRLLLYSFSLVLLIFSCTKDKTQAECGLIQCSTGTVSYSNDIVPLIQQSCATNIGPLTGCHDAWIFEYDAVKGAVDAGTFWGVISDKSMPKIPNTFGIDSLTQAEYEMFECWICIGAPNN
ncbi:MAG: hypothetical protein ACI865_001744 [Flavobacteriaceae bacterium]|jgi:hypothetical protein